MISKSAPGEGIRAARIVAMPATVLLPSAETTGGVAASLELEPVQRIGAPGSERRVGRVAGAFLQLERIRVEVVELGLGRHVLDVLPDDARLAARTVRVGLALRVDRRAAASLPYQGVRRKLPVP